jgi:hypothetical protein
MSPDDRRHIDHQGLAWAGDAAGEASGEGPGVLQRRRMKDTQILQVPPVGGPLRQPIDRPVPAADLAEAADDPIGQLDQDADVQ